MMKQSEIPVGFAMALAMNKEAMQKFATLGEEEKKMIIDGTHSLKSRDEMRQYVDSLVNGKR